MYDEAVTLTRSRTGRFRDVVSVSDLIIGENTGVDLLWVTRDLFFDAVETHRRYRDHGLSFTDATTITVIERRAIDSVLSFDGLVDRIDPDDA